MSRKFKIGDRVRLMSPFAHSTTDVMQGDLAVVTKLSGRTRMFVRFERESINHNLHRSRHGEDWGFEQFEFVDHPLPKVKGFGLDVHFKNVDDAIAAATFLAAHLNKPVGVKNV